VFEFRIKWPQRPEFIQSGLGKHSVRRGIFYREFSPQLRSIVAFRSGRQEVPRDLTGGARLGGPDLRHPSNKRPAKKWILPNPETKARPISPPTLLHDALSCTMLVSNRELTDQRLWDAERPMA